jgi:hypothetical protein
LAQALIGLTYWPTQLGLELVGELVTSLWGGATTSDKSIKPEGRGNHCLPSMKSPNQEHKIALSLIELP